MYAEYGASVRNHHLFQFGLVPVRTGNRILSLLRGQEMRTAMMVLPRIPLLRVVFGITALALELLTLIAVVWMIGSCLGGF